MSALETTASAAATTTEPVHLPWSTRFDLDSKIAGRSYRIFVFRPPLPPPPSGYPVLVALDGNMTFPIAAAMAATYTFSTTPAVVVGVGYPTDAPFDITRLRFRDLTPPTPAEAIPRRPGIPALGPDDCGGAPAFLRFLTEELRPAIAAAHPVDPERQSLFGYSLAGLFTLGALFDQPAAFARYIAASPSIWWNDRAVLSGEAGFVRAIEAKTAAPRVLISIGAMEQGLPHRAPPGMTAEDAEALIADARMVDNARDLAARLAAVQGGPGYRACFQAFEDEDHLTCLAAAVGRALDFATRP